MLMQLADFHVHQLFILLLPLHDYSEIHTPTDLCLSFTSNF